MLKNSKLQGNARIRGAVAKPIQQETPVKSKEQIGTSSTTRNQQDRLKPKLSTERQVVHRNQIVPKNAESIDNKKTSVDKKTPVTESYQLAKPSKTLGKQISSTTHSQPKVKPLVKVETRATKSKPKASTIITIPSKRQPVKAVHEAKIPISEKNVMNTVHNVTVVSPPVKRKDYSEQHNVNIEPDIQRQRTKTRTLDPDEVMVLNKKTVAPVTNNVEISIPLAVEVKEAVAFEINFNSEKAQRHTVTEVSTPAPNEDYEDDFDSYESDFESLSSNSSSDMKTSSGKSHTTSDNDDMDDMEEILASKNVTMTHENNSVNPSKGDEEPDSGTYELKILTSDKQQDSIDDRDVNSEGQNDSGFGYNTMTTDIQSRPLQSQNSISISEHTEEKMYTPHKQKASTKINQRGMDLMKKITLDTMSYALFEMQPISYEYYMKIYGHLNTAQSSTQTLDNLVCQDVQTDFKVMSSMWTQWPPQFTKNSNISQYHQDQIGCGNDDPNGDYAAKQNDFSIDRCLWVINKLSSKQNQTRTISTVNASKSIDYTRLNLFLLKSSITISGIISPNLGKLKIRASTVPNSGGFFALNWHQHNVLKNTRVYKLFSCSHQMNMVYAMHRNSQNTASDSCSFISVWSLLDPSKPMNVLSSWSPISCMEINETFADVVIAGLTDGSLAVWNLQESIYWHQSCDSQTVFIPSQLVAPILASEANYFDYGAVVSIKSFASTTDVGLFSHIPEQIMSLHEIGIITIWTMLQTKEAFHESVLNKSINHQSPWSTIKLVQSNCIELRSLWPSLNISLQPKSGFMRTRSYFEKNLFSDAALQELHDIHNRDLLTNEIDVPLQCTDLEFNGDEFFVTTNKNFVIFGTKSLHKDAIRKMFIDDSQLVNITKLKSIDNGKKMLVGRSDGSVKVLCCRETKERLHEQIGSSFTTINDRAENVDLLSAKSCAIQNIIKDERKVCDDGAALLRQNYPAVGEFSNGSDVTDWTNCQVQVLLHGLSSSQHHVKWMEHSLLNNHLFIQSGRNLRVFNLEAMHEINNANSSDSYSDATMTRGLHRTEYLVLLTENDIHVNVLSSSNFN